jgi:hypothetical protein
MTSSEQAPHSDEPATPSAAETDALTNPAARSEITGIRTPASDKRRDWSGSANFRGAWMSSGVSFFAFGVMFTIAMPDNFVMGISLLALGVVFFTLAGTKRAPGDGPADETDAAPDAAPGKAPGEAPAGTPSDNSAG